MAATFSFNQRTGASPGASVDLGSAGTLWAYKSADNSGTANYTSNPVTRGNNSYEVWASAHFSGAYNAITNIKLWGQATSPQTGVTIYGGATGSGAYATPVTGASPYATAAIPTDSASGLDLSNDATLVNSTNGFSKFAVIQMRTATTSPVGDVTPASNLQATLSYDEQ